MFIKNREHGEFLNILRIVLIIGIYKGLVISVPVFYIITLYILMYSNINCGDLKYNTYSKMYTLTF